MFELCALLAVLFDVRQACQAPGFFAVCLPVGCPCGRVFLLTPSSVCLDVILFWWCFGWLPVVTSALLSLCIVFAGLVRLGFVSVVCTSAFFFVNEWHAVFFIKKCICI
jgi:hypothetical protein